MPARRSGSDRPRAAAAAGLVALVVAGCTPDPCDLPDPTVLLGQEAVLVWWEDRDGDRWGGTEGWTCDPDGHAEAPPGTTTRGGDCDDDDAANSPGLSEVCDGRDNDCSGAPAEDEVDGDGDGARVCEGDCDDRDPSRRPGAVEVCDGADNDCSGAPGAEEDDADLDGYRGCEGDCDDGEPLANPGLPEVCDGVDNDCSGQLDPVELDQDGDGARACDDCNDGDPGNHYGGVEICDGRDNDCDFEADEGLTFGTWYPDDDGDGFGDSGDPAVTCGGAPPGHTAMGGDCDDGAAHRHPGAEEVCDGVDDDCDGLIDEGLPYGTWYPDADGDGYGDAGAPRTGCDGARVGEVAVAGDCDDADPAANPGEAEVCNGKDDDCDGDLPEQVLTVDESDYLFCPAAEGWEDARATCRAVGGGWDLAAVGSLFEQDELEGVLTSADVGDAWIGLNDRDEECSFRWADGSALSCPFVTDHATTCHLDAGATCGSFAWWEEGYPFDGGGAADCVLLLRGSLTDADGDGLPEPYHWAVSSCFVPLPFLCEAGG